ncbi:glycerate kinase type-2 family protein [Rubinisphaera brasiliensis]|uniref:Glycerate kinase n=1 Tax=Rubinisphaera brasiliensis (strain ATCC 49424 / DSM 5305 / JCM 21570 / IAM 15109 / NBRC 103401 / IFAM 1448) TaxID=756272 RepID=F0SM75_RUBBR|nr:DUF4147 domain-containing protein [Rubinisphaera brasiliensis]ADY61030.1 Glycerate kinase [Rubinisphaera brasiliensis DSM 5305]
MMMKDNSGRRELASRIWKAGVEAVDSTRLVREAIEWTEQEQTIAGMPLPMETASRLIVVGAGKAGAGMARGVEEAIPPAWAATRLNGWVNVPADCLPDEPLKAITLHAARPAGLNEPTEAGVLGTEKILQLVQGASQDDVCLVLISGGGSALLPAPVTGVSLEQKADLTRQLARAGATIEELNAVRRSLSQVKGGGLLRACRAGRLITLIISDVVGDPLETIASGPTIPVHPAPGEAVSILEKLLGADVANQFAPFMKLPSAENEVRCEYRNILLGSNQTALNAAAKHAETAGWAVESLGDRCVGTATDFSVSLINRACQHVQNSSRPLCLLAGGETTVPMQPGIKPGKGGRNQEVALVAIRELEKLPEEVRSRITLLAGGTDGEDGPTDAAGGFADTAAMRSLKQNGVNLDAALVAHDSYPVLKSCGALWQTGPTHTNVMDLTVVLVDAAR